MSHLTIWRTYLIILSRCGCVSSRAWPLSRGWVREVSPVSIHRWRLRCDPSNCYAGVSSSFNFLLKSLFKYHLNQTKPLPELCVFCLEVLSNCIMVLCACVCVLAFECPRCFSPDSNTCVSFRSFLCAYHDAPASSYLRRQHSRCLTNASVLYL